MSRIRERPHATPGGTPQESAAHPRKAWRRARRAGLGPGQELGGNWRESDARAQRRAGPSIGVAHTNRGRLPTLDAAQVLL